MFEPLLLANPDTNTLRPARSRASTIHPSIEAAAQITQPILRNSVFIALRYISINIA
jgi:hypothetical protein